MSLRILTHIVYVTVIFFSLGFIRCGCPSAPQQPSSATSNTPPIPNTSSSREWVQGSMELVGKNLESTIQQFKNGEDGMSTRKKALFLLVTDHYDSSEMSEHGKDIQLGKFSMSQELKKELLEKAVLVDTAFRKHITVHPNVPMPHVSSSSDKIVFTTNFGDSNLFGFYASNLFAQDEVQVAEMPHLAMLKYYYQNTKSQHLASSPGEAFIITHVPRYADINTKDIYGMAFSAISKASLQSTLQARLTYREPPTIHHILSIAAPNVSSKAGQAYTIQDFEKLFLPAFCAYQATHKALPQTNIPITIETGNWGAGAFGNDLRVSAIAQILAAAMSNVNLAIYPFDAAGEKQWERGIELLEQSIAQLQAAHMPLTPQHIFTKAQEIATANGGPLRARAGNGT